MDRNGPPLYKLYLVLSKTIHNSDSISVLLKIKYYDWKYSDLSYITFDSVINEHYGSLNQNYFDSFMKKDTNIIVNVNNKEYKIYSLKDSSYTDDCQLILNERRIDYTPVVSEHKLTKEIAVKGVGVLKYYAHPGRFDDFSNEELIYVKKGNDSCGTLNTLPTSLNTVFNTELMIFPNPCNQFFKVLNGFETLNILNDKGQLIYSYESTNEPISVKELKNGFYFIQMMKGDIVINSKLVVLH